MKLTVNGKLSFFAATLLFICSIVWYVLVGLGIAIIILVIAIIWLIVVNEERIKKKK